MASLLLVVTLATLADLVFASLLAQWLAMVALGGYLLTLRGLSTMARTSRERRRSISLPRARVASSARPECAQPRPSTDCARRISWPDGRAASGTWPEACRHGAGRACPRQETEHGIDP